MLERPATDERSSLLRTFVKYGRKKFNNVDTWAQFYKSFYGRNLRIQARVFVSGKYCQPILMFLGKARSLPYIGTSERRFICLGSSLMS
jgi:hypothetical protein